MTRTTPKFRAFSAGLVVLALFGAAHLAGHLSGPAEPRGVDEAALLRLMTTLRVEPIGRTTMEIFNGFSLSLSLASWALAAVGFILLPLRRTQSEALRRAARVYAAACLSFAAVSITHWFLAPTSMLVAASLLFIVSAVFEGRPRATMTVAP